MASNLKLSYQKWQLYFFFFFIAIESIFSTSLAQSNANVVDSRHQKTLHRMIGTQDAVLLGDSDGNILFAQNAAKSLIPASTLKLLTALVAFEYLGSNYRFVTEFYLDHQRNLKVKGYGDPLLISEELLLLANGLQTKLESFHDLVLDDSFFSHPLLIPGVTSSNNPYDAPTGALCVNFNTVKFRQNGPNHYVSGEPQTPLLPFVLKRIKLSGLTKGRIILSSVNNENLMYAGHLIRYFLNQAGIQTKGEIIKGRVNQTTDKLIYRHVSTFTVKEMVQQLLEYSNNYIANQLLIAAGAKFFGPPGSLAKGVRLADNFAHRKLKIDQLQLVEGSGISRLNRMTAHGLHHVLLAFAPYYHLMSHKNGEFYKTGTLSNIRTRAGFFETTQNRLYGYVVMINSAGKPIEPFMQQLRRLLPAYFPH